MSDGVKWRQVQTKDGEAIVKEYDSGGVVLSVSDGVEAAAVGLSDEELKTLVAPWIGLPAQATNGAPLGRAALDDMIGGSGAGLGPESREALIGHCNFIQVQADEWRRKCWDTEKERDSALLRAERAEAMVEYCATMHGGQLERLRLAEAVVEAARDVSLADESPDHTDAQREDRHALLHVALCAYDAATKEGHEGREDEGQVDASADRWPTRNGVRQGLAAGYMGNAQVGLPGEGAPVPEVPPVVRAKPGHVYGGRVMTEHMENPENVILADAARLTRDMQRGSEVVALLGEQVRRLRHERDRALDAFEKACTETDSWKEHAKSVQAARSEGRRAALLEAAKEARFRAHLVSGIWPDQDRSTYPRDALVTLAEALEAEANALEVP